jgi:tetratricopeptide (TPR) repeat protein
MNSLIYFTKANEIDPNNSDCLFILGNYYLYENNFKKALYFFKKLNLNLNDTKISTASAENLNMLGLCMLNMNEIENSIEYFKNALEITNKLELNGGRKNLNSTKLNSDNFYNNIQLLSCKINNNLGNSYRKLKDYENCLKFYLKSLSCDNLHAQSITCFNLGTMLIAKGDFLLGLNYLEKASKSCNKVIDAYINRKGFCYLFCHCDVKHAILLYYNRKYNNSIIKLKKIYLMYESNPIINMFLAYNYLCLRKYEKSILFLINYSN